MQMHSAETKRILAAYEAEVKLLERKLQHCLSELHQTLASEELFYVKQHIERMLQTLRKEQQICYQLSHK